MSRPITWKVLPFGKFETFIYSSTYPFIVMSLRMLRDDEGTAIASQCEDLFGRNEGRWSFCRNDDVFLFLTEADLTLFLLTFTGFQL